MPNLEPSKSGDEHTLPPGIPTFLWNNIIIGREHNWKANSNNLNSTATIDYVTSI